MKTAIVEDRTTENDVDGKNKSVMDIEVSDLHYNFTLGLFGWGDDMRDWSNRSEKYVEVEEVEKLPNGKIKMWYEKC